MKTNVENDAKGKGDVLSDQGIFEGAKDHSTAKLIENEEVVVEEEDVTIYCQEPYAQELYDIMKYNHPTNASISKGEKVTGKVKNKTNELAEIDCGMGKTVFIDKDKEDKKYFRQIKKDDEIIIKIKSRDHDIFGVLGSHTEAKKEFVINELIRSMNDRSTAYTARIKELITGGFLCEIDGIKVFMPGSLASMNKVNDFQGFIGKDIEVIPVNYAEGYIIVSHKEYLKAFIPHEIEKLEIGEWYNGKVTGTTKFGVFVEFNECLTGLIHVDDLDKEWQERFKNNNIKPDEELGFYLKEISKVKGQKRLILTRIKDNIGKSKKNNKPNKQSKLDSIQVPTETKGTVENVTNYGLFVKIDEDITGLLHKSELDEDPKNFEEGDQINVKIYRVDKEDEKVHLKII